MMLRTSGSSHPPNYDRQPTPTHSPARDVVLVLVGCVTLIVALVIGGVL